MIPIPWNLLAGVGIVAAFAGGVWLYGDRRYDAGMAEVQVEWNAANERARSVARDAAASRLEEEANLNRQRKEYYDDLRNRLAAASGEAASAATALAARDVVVDRLRQLLAARAAASGVAGNEAPVTSGGSNAPSEPWGVLSQSVDLASAAGRLLEEGRSELVQCAAQVTALQRHARAIEESQK